MTAIPDDEGVLDLWVADCLAANPLMGQPFEHFSPEMLALALTSRSTAVARWASKRASPGGRGPCPRHTKQFPIFPFSEIAVGSMVSVLGMCRRRRTGTQSRCAEAPALFHLHL